MIIIGIDPGLKGALATLSPSYTKTNGVRVELKVMPESMAEVIAHLEWHANGEGAAHVFIEKAQSMPRQGISSAFNYGTHFGHLLGIIQALGLAHTQVGPRTWTKAMHLGTFPDEPKKRSLEAAQRLFPDIKLTATDRSKKPHDGLVDALLIAEYGRRIMQGKQ